VIASWKDAVLLAVIVAGILWYTVPRIVQAWGRPCPVCGHRVSAGVTACGSCGHDFEDAT